jgi:hypothetical protein
VALTHKIDKKNYFATIRKVNDINEIVYVVKLGPLNGTEFNLSFNLLEN